MRMARIESLSRAAIALCVLVAPLVAALALGRGRAQETPPLPRFFVAEVFVDAGETPLAAWQCEIEDTTGRGKLIGIEGGEPDVFAALPRYDPAALRRSGRVILAAFTTAEDLPAGRVRVARLHLVIEGDGEPDLVVRGVVAGGRDGREIPGAKVAIEKDAVR